MKLTQTALLVTVGYYHYVNPMCVICVLPHRRGAKIILSVEPYQIISDWTTADVVDSIRRGVILEA